MAKKENEYTNPAEALIKKSKEKKKEAETTAPEKQEEVHSVATKEIKRGRGRPKAAGGKSKQISLMIEPDLYERIAEVAAKQGISASGLIRMGVLNYLESLEK